MTVETEQCDGNRNKILLSEPSCLNKNMNNFTTYSLWSRTSDDSVEQWPQDLQHQSYHCKEILFQSSDRTSVTQISKTAECASESDVSTCTHICCVDANRTRNK